MLRPFLVPNSTEMVKHHTSTQQAHTVTECERSTSDQTPWHPISYPQGRQPTTCHALASSWRGSTLSLFGKCWLPATACLPLSLLPGLCTAQLEVLQRLRGAAADALQQRLTLWQCMCTSTGLLLPAVPAEQQCACATPHRAISGTLYSTAAVMVHALLWVALTTSSQHILPYNIQQHATDLSRLCLNELCLWLHLHPSTIKATAITV